MDSTHRQRIVTAVLLLLLPAGGVYFGGWVLAAVLALFSGLGQWEFCSMFWPGRRAWLKALAVINGSLLLAAFQYQNPTLVALAALVGFWCAALSFLFAFGRNPEDTSFHDAGVFLISLAYIPLALHFFLFFKPAETVLVILAAAASDTAAFYAGTRLGKRRIWPTVSPKKSWAGSVGGMIGCVLLITGLGLALGRAPWWAFALLGVFLNLAAQMGDFFESALKRSLGIKDSGTLLPGHGGLLDRIDSLLLVVPAYALARAALPLFGD